MQEMIEFAAKDQIKQWEWIKELNKKRQQKQEPMDTSEAQQ